MAFTEKHWNEKVKNKKNPDIVKKGWDYFETEEAYGNQFTVLRKLMRSKGKRTVEVTKEDVILDIPLTLINNLL